MKLWAEKVHKNSPFLWRLHPSTKIFQQKCCPIVIQALIMTSDDPVDKNSKKGISVDDDDDDNEQEEEEEEEEEQKIEEEEED
jgi:hypothetical protein